MLRLPTGIFYAGLVGLTNVVCQVGIAQQAVAAALCAPDAAAVSTWKQRRVTILDQLSDYPCIRPDGGWSLLLDTTPAVRTGTPTHH